MAKKRKKNYYGIISSQHRLEKAEKMRKLKLSFRSVPTRRVIENFKKNSKKIQKINKNHNGRISSQNRLENAEKDRK